jgi:4-alpha-glucanotransferase
MLSPGIDPEAPPAEACEDLVVTIHRYLAETPGYLVMVQLEDAVGEEEQPNLPGTDGHPNWRRKLRLKLEDLPDHPMVRRIAAVMAASGRSARR